MPVAPIRGTAAEQPRVSRMETVLAVLHVLSAVFLVGPTAILPMTAMRVLRAGDRRQVGGLAKSTEVFSFASLAAVVFGFGVMGMSDPKYDLSITTPWILISLVLYLVALGLNLGMVVPAMQAAGRDANAAQAAQVSGKPAGYSRIAMGSGLVSLLLVIVVILMVWKP